MPSLNPSDLSSSMTKCVPAFGIEVAKIGRSKPHPGSEGITILLLVAFI